MRNHSFASGLALAIVSFVVAAPASAALDGTSIAVDYRFPDVGTIYPGAEPSVTPFVVGAGIESTVNVEAVTFIDVDFTDLGLTLTFNTLLGSPTWSLTSFNGLMFTGSGFEKLVSATLLPTTNFGGGTFTQGGVTLAGEELRLNWGGIPYADGQQLHIAFAAVPEPMTWAMLIIGFGLVGGALRHRRRQPIRFTG